MNNFFRILREDSNGRIYVSGATEKEVNSAEEAFTEFEKGQMRRNNLLANLQAKSGCYSQTVFIIKVVHTRSKLTAENISKVNFFHSVIIIIILS